MKKQQVFYIHGGESFLNYDDFLERLRTRELWHLPKEGEENNGGKKWNANLNEELGEEFEVVAPPMPNKQNAKFNEWSIWFERHFDYLKDGVILIGCSLGAMFLAKYLSQNNLPFRPKAVFLMAGAYKLPGLNEKEGEDFMVTPKEAAKLANKTDKVIIVHSEDDFVVPFEHGEALSQAMPQAEFMKFTDKNHFLIEEFPELIEKIKSV